MHSALSLKSGCDKKPGSLGNKNEERTPSKETRDKNKEHKEESAGSIKSHKKGDKKKKKMKKVVYYETDSSSPSTSSTECIFEAPRA